MRAYDLDDVLDFGKHKGKTVKEVFCGSPRLSVQHAPELIRKLVRVVLNIEGAEHLIDLRKDFNHDWLEPDVFAFVEELNKSFNKLELHFKLEKNWFGSGFINLRAWSHGRPSELMAHRAGVVVHALLKLDYHSGALNHIGVSMPLKPNHPRDEKLQEDIFGPFEAATKADSQYLVWCLRELPDFCLSERCASTLPAMQSIEFRSFASAWREGAVWTDDPSFAVAVIEWEPLFSVKTISEMGAKIKALNAEKLERLSRSSSDVAETFSSEKGPYDGPNGHQRYLNDAFDGEAGGYWNVE